MTAHLCPLTLGQILALAAIAKVAGHERLAGPLLDHSTQHDTEGDTTHE